jgi:hypothetical protein
MMTETTTPLWAMSCSQSGGFELTQVTGSIFQAGEPSIKKPLAL